METGRRGIRPAELQQLLVVYGASEAQQEVLLTLARHTHDTNWRRFYSYSADPYQDLIGQVFGGITVSTFEAQFIPGLLQIEDYVQAIAATAVAGAGDDEREQFVQDRLATQQFLVSDGGAVGLSAIVSEAALRQLVGRPAVMRTQLHHLLGVISAQGTVTIQVLPFTEGAHAATSGSFSIMTFPGPNHPTVVSLTSQIHSFYLDDDEDTARYSLFYQRLRRAALPHEQSAQLIEEIAQNW